MLNAASEARKVYRSSALEQSALCFQEGVQSTLPSSTGNWNSPLILVKKSATARRDRFDSILGKLYDISLTWTACNTIAMDPNQRLDSAPLTEAFSFSKEKQRALYGLRGILSGVVADQKLNEKEFLFLDVWLQSQQFLAGDGEVLQILTKVGEILEDGQINPEELQEMRDLLNTFLARTEEDHPGNSDQINELMGFLTGIASDGVLNDSEVSALDSWLNSHNSVRLIWPASVIIDRLNIILDDGVISEEERNDLLQTLRRITSSAVNPTGISYEASTEVWEDEVDSVEIEGKVFCLTGDFVSGDRSAVETMLRLKGAQLSPNVNKQVKYLVIGTLASRDWLYTSHGRKIEKALLLKRANVAISVITERTLLRYLN